MEYVLTRSWSAEVCVNDTECRGGWVGRKEEGRKRKKVGGRERGEEGKDRIKTNGSQTFCAFGIDVV